MNIFVAYFYEMHMVSFNEKYLSRFGLINTSVLVSSEFLLERERERERRRRIYFIHIL
jgi:hypothetical protein